MLEKSEKVELYHLPLVMKIFSKLYWLQNR